MRPKISIIIPVYNTAALLPRCLDSIQNQTLKEIEILLIDDGSIDDSMNVCKSYCKEDSRFKYWHKENGGSASARNVGIHNAIGEYIFFIDSDDYIKENACEVAYNSASLHEVDILNFGYTYIDDKGKKDKRWSVFPKNELFYKDLVLELLKRDTLHNKLLWFPVQYLFRTDFMNKNSLFFNENVKLGDDADFNLRCLLNSEKSYSIKDNLYFYVYNESSQTQSKYREGLLQKFRMQFETRVQVHKEFNIFTKDYIVEIAVNYIEHSLFELFNNEYTNHSHKKAFENIKKFRKDSLFVFCCEHYKYSEKCTRNKKILITLFLWKLFYPLHILLKRI